MAKISVILPAYNAEKTLRTAVESILSPAGAGDGNHHRQRWLR